MQKRNRWEKLGHTLGVVFLVALVVGLVLTVSVAKAADPYDVGERVQQLTANATMDADNVLTAEGELRVLGGAEGAPGWDFIANGDAVVYLYELNSSNDVVRRYGPFYLWDNVARSPVPAGRSVALIQVTAMTTATKVVATPRRAR